jgi:hypothetical protein
VKKFSRIGWNQAGTSWVTASLIQNGETFCGSINVPLDPCVTDHYFNIQLQPGDALHVHGIFTASTGSGSATSLKIYDNAQHELDLLLNEAVYGTAENSGSYINTGQTTETFYLILKSQWGDLWEYELQFFNAAYVNSTGFCGGKIPCYSSIQAAINAAHNSQFILIAQGTYVGSVTLNQSKSLTLLGGWDPSFDTKMGTTILQQEPKAQQGSLTLREIIIEP